MTFLKTICLLALLSVAYAADTNVTTTATPSTSTENPTTPAPPAPAPAPGPKPEPVNVTGPVHFELHNGDIVCATGEFNGEIVLTGLEKPTTLTLDVHTTLNKDKSQCNDKKVVLFFNVEGKDENVFTLTLEKEKDDYKLDGIGAIYDYTDPKDANKTKQVEVALKDQVVFTVGKDKSYACMAKTVLQLADIAKVPTVNATLTLEHVKIDAFRTSNSTELRAATECAMDNKGRDYVPLAVAIALVSLIVIVLISYLIGRKRSRRLAYESV